MKRISSLYIILIFIGLLISSCSSTFRTMNINQPVYLSPDKVTIDGKIIPEGTKDTGIISGEVLFSHTSSYNETTTEEKANADVDFMNCVKTDATRFVTGLEITVTNYQYLLFGGGKCRIEYRGNCHQLPNSKN